MVSLQMSNANMSSSTLDNKVYTVHDLTSYSDGNLLLNRCLHLSDLSALSKGTIEYSATNGTYYIPDSDGKIELMTWTQKMEFVSDWYLNKNWNIRPRNIAYGRTGDHRVAVH